MNIIDEYKLSATARLRDGVTNAFRMAYSWMPSSWRAFKLPGCLLDTSKDPPKTATAASLPLGPPTLWQHF